MHFEKGFRGFGKASEAFERYQAEKWVRVMKTLDNFTTEYDGPSLIFIPRAETEQELQSICIAS